jgi:two-component system sensor histidine kinase AtoS
MPSHSTSNGRRARKRFVPLRIRFVAITAGLLVLLLGTLALILGYAQSRTIENRLQERGLDIAAGLSATAVTTLINYNYVALEQLANEAAKDPEIVYVIVHDKEGRIAGYSGRPDLQHTVLSDAVSMKAVAALLTVIQRTEPRTARYPVLDVAVPVRLEPAGEKWGTIRVGLSYEAIFRQLRQLILIIVAVGTVALCIGVMAAVWAAGRITRPLKRLVAATVEATRGTLAPNIDIRTSDEVEILADNFSAMMREIIAHKEMLEAQLAEIRHMQQYTDKLLTTMNDGLLSFDLEGRVKSINPAACRLLGCAESAGTDNAILELVGGRDGLDRYVRDKLARPAAAPHEEIFLDRPDGGQVLMVGASVIEGHGGAPEEVILNLHDITEQKKMEARIRQAERLAALGTLAAGMAHEIRNPLSAIKTFVQLLPRKLAKEGFLDKFNRTVPREINRINDLVEDLLDLARKPRYEFSPTDMGDLLNRNLDVFEGEFTARDIRCRRMDNGDLPMVSADASQLDKAVQNLLRNALQAMPGGGTLTLDMRLTDEAMAAPSGAGGWIVIGIEDTGEGIDPGMLNEIFNPFFTSKDQGTGLGLAITHKVITEHGGHIEVSSRPGEGTRFTVYLRALAPGR